MKEKLLYSTESCALSSLISIPKIMKDVIDYQIIHGVDECIEKLGNLLSGDNIISISIGDQNSMGTNLFVELDMRGIFTIDDVYTLTMITNFLHREEIKEAIVTRDNEYTLELYQKTPGVDNEVMSYVHARLNSLSISKDMKTLKMKFIVVSIEV